VRQLIRQSGNLAFGGHVGASRAIVSVVGWTDGGQRLARMLASRCVVDCGSHALAGSAMR
jgi:hypothetical protein